MLLLSVVVLPCACLLRSFSILLYSKCGVCAFSSHSLYVSTVGLDEAFTVLFVQLCLVPCDVLTVSNHVIFRCLFGPDLPDGPRLCCSLADECVGEPLLSFDPPSTSTQCKLPWIQLLLHLQSFFVSLYLRPLFQQSAFGFRCSQPSSSWPPTNALVHPRQ
jgi:hypothetical protein